MGFMSESPIILNEREARRTRALLARVDETLSVRSALAPARYSISAEVWEMHGRALAGARATANSMLETFEAIKSGKFVEVASRWKHEPGVVLIIARIARGLSQGELAERLNMREQQVQRYESERYRTISLQAMRRVAAILGVQIEASVGNAFTATLASLRVPPEPIIDDRQLSIVVAHAKKNNWFDVSSDDETNRQRVADYVVETTARFGSPGLLRTGLKSLDLRNDTLLAVWRARVFHRADEIVKSIGTGFDQVSLEWVVELARLSAHDNGPARAIELCREKGIAIVVEPQLQGLKLDGAAFLYQQVPVVGLTLRHDRIDNFWYTLLHEIGHIFLHYNSGLVAGFFDEDSEHTALDEVEAEADQFAASMLIPPERWKQSTVRVTRSPASVEQFAKQLGIHPAIVFGRLRRERNDYSQFHDLVGLGQVRQQFLKHMETPNG